MRTVADDTPQGTSKEPENGLPDDHVAESRANIDISEDDRLTLLDGVISVASQAISLERGLEDILRLTVTTLGSDIGAIVMIDRSSGDARVACEYAPRGPLGPEGDGRELIEPALECARVARPLLRNRETGDAVIAGFQRTTTAPVCSGPTVYGALALASKRPGKRHARTALALEAVGKLAGDVVKRARAEDEIRRFNADLEAQIGERTRALADANRSLQAEVDERRRAERTLQSRTTELEALLDASRAMAASIDYDRVLVEVATSAGRALGSPQCVVWEYSPEDDLAVFRCLYERDPTPRLAESLAGSSYPISSSRGGLQSLRAGVITQESLSDPDLSQEDREDMMTWGEKTWLTVPLVFGNELLGIMILIEIEQEREFDADEIRMASAIGRQAAVALHNARRHRREAERNRWLQSLVEAGRIVSAGRDPEASLEQVARLAADAVQAPAAFIYEYQTDRDALVMRAKHGPRTRRRDAVGQAFPVGDAPDDRRALELGEVFVETLRDTSLTPAVREAMLEANEKTLLNVPLRTRDDTIGMLVLAEDERERVFTRDEQEFMGAFGEQITMALVTARLATVDGLTGLANHRTFYERLHQELTRAKRYSMPLSLLMLDIDDFKAVNDTLGHPAGDEVLHMLGRILSEQLRRNVDLPARYGGEEFAIVLPNTIVDGRDEASDAGAASASTDAAPADAAVRPGHHEGAEALAERLRRTIAETPFELSGRDTPARITVSIGIAAYPEATEEMDELVARADAALYAAKRAGKNRVESCRV